jgi:hypothetical protein
MSVLNLIQNASRHFVKDNRLAQIPEFRGFRASAAGLNVLFSQPLVDSVADKIPTRMTLDSGKIEMPVSIITL